MRLRFPGLSELAALFVADSSVGAAVSSLQRARVRLLKVIQIQKAKAAERIAARQAYLREADRLDAEATAALHEVAHAERVAGRLEELCA